MTFWWRH